MKKHPITETYLLSDIGDEELRSKLEHKYIEFETLKSLSVETQRMALRSQANAMKTAAEVQLAQLDFLIQASEAFPRINMEPMWMLRRRGDGEVVLECLVTERDMQRMAKAQTKQMKDQLEEISGHDNDEDDEEDDGIFRKK